MTIQEVMLLEAVLFLVVSGVLALANIQAISRVMFLFGIINLVVAAVSVGIDLWV